MLTRALALVAVLPLLLLAQAAVPTPAAGPIIDLCGFDIACHCDALGWDWCGSGREEPAPVEIERDDEYPTCDAQDDGPPTCPYETRR